MILSSIIFCLIFLSMLMPKEISRNDIVKILVSEDGIEEETYGLVAANTGRTLGMHYLYPTEMHYKSACVYRLDDDEMCPAPYESVMEHYPTGTTFEDLDLKSLGSNMFAYFSEINPMDDDSDIYDEGDSGSDTSLSGFIVSDTEVEGLPIDHKEVDAAWNEWEPSTSGGRSFKETIDLIENRERARNLSE